jgi:acyl-CoA synthetase (AMP-forming)/AMP-acid ligase II
MAHFRPAHGSIGDPLSALGGTPASVEVDPGDDQSILRFLRRRYATSRDDLFCLLVVKRQEIALSVGGLVEAAARWAARFAEAGVRPGDIVLIFLGHGIDQYAAYVGAMMHGAVPSFMPPPSPKQDKALYWEAHRQLFARIGPGALVTSTALRASLSAQLDSGAVVIVTPDDVAAVSAGAPRWRPAAGAGIALLQHSSGTTSLKKGVCLSHAAIERQLAAYADALDLGEHDRIATWLPLYHDMGLVSCFLLPLVRGVPFIALDPFEWVVAPWRLLDAIERFRATLAWLPNFAFHHLCRTRVSGRRHDLSSLRALIDCSEPCRAETFDRFVRDHADCNLGVDRLQVCYAMAETVFAVSQTALGAPVRRLSVDAEALQRDELRVTAAGTPDSRPLLSAGRPLAGVRVAVCDPAGAALPDGRVGEITVSADFLFDGYLGRPDDTARKLVDGVYHTSDRGFLWEGELFVLGRNDDLIIVNGRNYYAHELEFEASQATGIKPGRLVALGVEEVELGTHVVAIVGETEAPIDEHAAIALAVRGAIAQACDLLIHDVALVPPGWIVKTTSGKLSRRENLERYVALRGCPRTPTFGSAEIKESRRDP